MGSRAKISAVILLIVTSLLLSSLTSYHDQVSSRAKGLEIIVLVDNNASPTGRLKEAWGISILVRTDGTTVLFDAGPDPEVLRHNCEVMGIDLSSVDFVVLSHEHADHTGGVPYVISRKPGVEIYVPEGFNEDLIRHMTELGAKVVKLRGPTKLREDIMTLGPLKGPPAEQGLLVRGPRGWVLLTGCAHPGIEEMVRKAKDLTDDLYAVIGGFHLIGASTSRLEGVVKAMEDAGVKEVYPIHCSGDEARPFLRDHLLGVYRDAHVGSVIRWPGDDREAGDSGG